VALHVFWQTDPGSIHAPPYGIRQIALEHQLAAPLTELISLFRTSQAEIFTGEKPGHCYPLLLSLPPGKLKMILEEAGWHRLRLRRSLAQARIASFGLEQAGWIALAEGLGFSENREPFASLARVVPIQKLLAITDPVDRQAVLFGVAHLLPDPTRSPVSPRALPWVKELWKRWWLQRELWAPHILSSDGWRFGSTRPNNSPYRRLAALSYVSYPHVWQVFIKSICDGDAAVFLKLLLSASHHFWDHHSDWNGRILSSSFRLVGADRATALLFQVLAPLTDLTEAELGSRMDNWPAGGDAGLLRSASMRLLGAPFPPPDIRSHLAREGLLQIYKDFCRAKPCTKCSMPKFLKSR